MKQRLSQMLAAAAILGLALILIMGSVPASAAADNTGTDNNTGPAGATFLQNWGHSNGQSCATSWGSSTWIQSKKG